MYIKETSEKKSMALMNLAPSALFGLMLFGILNVTAEIRFEPDGQPTDKTVLHGDPAYFHCFTYGLRAESTRYRITWFFMDKLWTILNSEEYDTDRYSFSTRSGIPGEMLTIKRSDVTDQGHYQCALNVNDRLNTYSEYGYLRVIQKPSFQHPLISSALVVEGQSVLLHCRIQNFDVDLFSVSWFRNSVQLSQNYYISYHDVSLSYGDIKIVGQYMPTTGYDLKITNVSKASQGYFHCSVFMGSRQVLKSRFAWLTVLYPPDKQYPLCTPQTPDLNSKGDTLRTRCHSQGGNSQVEFFWIKDGKVTHAPHGGDNRVGKEWTLTERDNGTFIFCSMIGPAILDERQCTIGPIRVYNGQVSSDSTTEAIHNTDKIPSFLISSEATSSVTSTLSRIAMPQAQTRTRQISSPLMSSGATLPDTTLSRMITSQAQTRTRRFEVRSSKVTGNHLTYILTVLIGILIVIVITITAVCVRSKKTGVRDNAGEATNRPRIMNEYESCRVTNTGVEDTVHYDVLRRIVSSDLNLRSAETMDVESSFSSETLPNDNVAVVTADVTYASVCKRKLNTTNTTDYDKLSFPCSGNGSGNHRSKGDKKSRNVEGLVYAELDLQQSDSLARTAASTLRREEPSVIYSELQHPK